MARIESQISQCALLVKGSGSDENHNPSQHNDWQDEAYFFDTYFLVENCVCVCDLIEWLADLYVQYVVVTLKLRLLIFMPNPSLAGAPE